MRHARWLAVGAALVVCFGGLGGALRDPGETQLAERLLCGDFEGLPVADLVAFGGWLRAWHALLGVAAIAAVVFAARGCRPGVLAAAALVGAPAFAVATHALDGGIAAVAPIVVATYGVIAAGEHGRRRDYAIAAIGTLAAALAVGVAAVAVVVVGLVARRVRPVIVVAGAAALGAGIAWLAGAKLWPSGGTDPRAFADALGDLALGGFPLVLVTFAHLVLTDGLPARTRGWLVCAIVLAVGALIYPHDPWLALAPLGPLAVIAGDALADLIARDEPTPAPLVTTLAIVALVIARCFDLQPARLGAGVAAFGWAGWLCVAVFATALAAALRTRRLAAVAIALGAADLLAIDTAWRRVQPESVASLMRADLPLTGGLGLAGHGVELATGHRVQELVDVPAVAGYLSTGCRATVIPSDRLAELERIARGRFVVLGDEAAGLRLVASCLPAGATNGDLYTDTLVDRLPSPLPGTPVYAEWGHAIRLRAVDVPAHVTLPEADIPVTLVFEVIAPIEAAAPIALRLEGCNQSQFGDHGAIADHLPTTAMRPGDVIVDHAKLELDDPVACRYTLTVGIGGRAPLPAADPFAREDQRVPVATVTVEAAAR